ncbi:chloroplast envelope quinone oxidoreductase homolog isoform X1 [Vigna umbellata]|uniref:chloroplast envelope quinone oxidoreductase homolog isoform X1 n=1 Tax=Vigna umbellata TaxID=87088 RepID=UPI001F5E83E6|nr:chloroplast envelope quinone oxidoreductase homolog isoform X1 [Vigna umbellata]XP_047181013.1 chloroplast envelope quinone oxidoreductase homolog isoform X1 [Vigna umbellata]
MAKNVMNAIQYEKYGGGPGGLKHVEVGVPSPKKKEVLVKVEAVSINPVDWKIQKGVMRPLFVPGNFPHTPCIHLFSSNSSPSLPSFLLFTFNKISFLTGTDVAGEVVQIGPQVNDFKVGDKVLSKLSTRYGGGLAEFAVASESLTASRPPEVSAAEAAALPIAGLTARDALAQIAGVKLDGTGEPKNVLVTAASGGVGHYAVQLAKLGNNHVTATCGARNIEFVKGLGADEVLDYRTPEGAALKSPSGRKYDAVINCTTGIPWSTLDANLTEKAVVVDLTPNPSSFLTAALKKVTFSKKRLVPFFVDVKREGLDNLLQLLKDGKLKSVIDSRFPLSKAEDAWAKSIDGHATGKIIVEP